MENNFTHIDKPSLKIIELRKRNINIAFRTNNYWSKYILEENHILLKQRQN